MVLPMLVPLPLNKLNSKPPPLLAVAPAISKWVGKNLYTSKETFETLTMADELQIKKKAKQMCMQSRQWIIICRKWCEQL